MTTKCAQLLAGLLLALSIVSARAAGPPLIPVGLDACRQWERWPYQRIGARAYMRSTNDRTGDNESADASHFLYQESTTFNVSLDVEGPGVLVFTRYNHWHGSPWHYEVDGTDHLVQETTSADPTKPVAGSVFLPAELFPSPLAWTWSITKGADLMWVPIPFEKSFCMAYTRTLFHHDVVGEFSVTYLERVKRYIMLFNHKVGQPRGIIMRSATDPGGPWSEGVVIFEPWRDAGFGRFMHIPAKFKSEGQKDVLADPNQDNTWGAEYGPYVMGRYTTGTGGQCRIYYTMSTWNPYQVVIMRSDLKLGADDEHPMTPFSKTPKN